MSFNCLMRCLVKSLFLVGVFVSISLSQDACEEKTTPLELSECLEKQYREQDSILNSLYKEVMNKISMVYKDKPKEVIEMKELLKKMQRQWIDSRDQHCNFLTKIATIESPSTSSQLHQSTFVAISCKTEYTKDRIRQLKEIIMLLDSR